MTLQETANLIIESRFDDIRQMVTKRVHRICDAKEIEVPDIERQELIDDAICLVFERLPSFLDGSDDVATSTRKASCCAARDVCCGRRQFVRDRSNRVERVWTDLDGFPDRGNDEYKGPKLDTLLSVLDDSERPIALAIALGDGSKATAARTLGINVRTVYRHCDTMRTKYRLLGQLAHSN